MASRIEAEKKFYTTEDVLQFFQGNGNSSDSYSDQDSPDDDVADTTAQTFLYKQVIRV